LPKFVSNVVDPGGFGQVLKGYSMIKTFYSVKIFKWKFFNRWREWGRQFSSLQSRAKLPDTIIW